MRMAKEKRIKTAVVRARITEEKMSALREYCKENNVTITKLIDDFLSDLLKGKKLNK
jgi:hypothetical protein